MARTPAVLSIADVDEFTRKLKATVAAAELSSSLLEVVERFNGGGKPQGRAGRPAKAAAPLAAKKPSRARRPGLDPAKALTALSGAKDGMSVSEVAAKLGEKDKLRVAAALKKLREGGKAKLKGDRRFARWFAV